MALAPAYGGGGNGSGQSVITLDGKSYRLVACVLRQSSVGSGWYAIDDSTHAPVGLRAVDPVTEGPTGITIHYDFTAAKIGSLVITPDETYSNTMLSFGASVGTASSLIQLRHPFWARVSGTAAVSNAYFGAEGGDWSFTATTGNGTYVFTHPAETHTDSSGSPVIVQGLENGVHDRFGVTVQSKSGFTLAGLNAIAGRISGGSVVTENATAAEGGTDSTVAWDGTDTMTITHPVDSSANGPSVVSEDPQYHAAVTAASTTTITVKFYDISTGAAYTGASAPCDVQYRRGGVTPSQLGGTSKCVVQRSGPCLVNPTNVASGSGNLWVYGLFEV